MDKTNKKSSIRRCVDLLNSVLSLVFMAFMLDSLYASDLLGVIAPFSLLFLIPLKIYLYSGIYSCLLSLTSGEEIVVTRRMFNAFAKQYWPVYFFISLLPFLLGVLLVVLTGGFLNVKPVDLGYCFDFYLLFLMAIVLIKKKYFKGGKFSLCLFDIQLSEFFIFLFLLCFNLMCNYSVTFLQPKYFEVSWPFIFLSHYVHFLSFIFVCDCLLARIPAVCSALKSEQELFLVNPLGGGIYGGVCSLFLRQYPPVFVCLKALTPKNYKFREFNRIFFSKRYYAPDKLVAITCYTSNCYEAYKIAKEYKRRGSVVIMGGPHVTCCPDEALAFCDSVVLCGVEGVWEDVVRDYEAGNLKKKYFKEATEAEYQKIHQELLNSPPWIVKSFIETTRGCKFKCYFCTDPFLNRGKILKKPIREVVELIRIVKRKYSVIAFIDNNIFSDPGYSKALFLELKKLRIKWAASCSIDIAKDDEMLKLARESGCKSLLIGYEIFGDSAESHRGGKLALAKQYLEYSKKLKKAGIAIKAHFIYGFPTDSLKTLFQLWLFCFRLCPQLTAVGFLIPFPGSRFYYDMIHEGRLVNLNWRRYNLYSLVFDHRKLKTSWVHFCFPLIHCFFFATTSFVGYVFFIFSLITFYFIDIKGYYPF